MTKTVCKVLLVVVVACSQPATTDSTTPPPATEAEIETLCARYEEVRGLDYGAKYTALLDVAPAELKGPLFRMVNNPGPTEDDFRVTSFLNDHCKF